MVMREKSILAIAGFFLSTFGLVRIDFEFVNFAVQT